MPKTCKPLSVKHPVAVNVRKAREEAGWTVNRLMQETGLSYNALYNIEHGNTLPQPATRQKLTQVLGIKWED